MLKAHILVWGLGGLGLVHFGVAAESATPQVAQVIGPEFTEKDQWRYFCAEQIVEMSKNKKIGGSLFFEEGVLFTSVTANNGKPILILQTKNAVYAVVLPDSIIRRVKLILPKFENPNSIYISYFHEIQDNKVDTRRRYFEFSINKPPSGKLIEEYKVIRASLTPGLKSHLDFLLLEQIEATVIAVMDGKIKPNKPPQSITACEKLAKVTPVLNHYARRSLAAIGVMIAPQQVNVSSRMPASVFSN